MDCNAASSTFEQQAYYSCACNGSKSPKKKKKSKKAAKKSTCKPKLDCDEDFTASGMEPEKTAGPLSSDMGCCTKFAACGCWKCSNDCDRVKENCFQGYQASTIKAPFGPYGPWSCMGPSQFQVARPIHINQIYKVKAKRLNGLDRKTKHDQPMGKMCLWPLSGSCRYAGRPFGPCRPLGAFKSRGPFGLWTMTSDSYGRPDTPAQPCWAQTKPGYRPCTPCHRPLYRPCRDNCKPVVKCDYVEMTE